MEELLKQILDGQKELFEGQKQLFEGQKQLHEKVDSIKDQQDENTSFIGALLHRTEELDAKFDGLLHNTLTKDSITDLATKEDIASLDAKFEVLNSRLFHQEAELFRIKAVK